MRISFRNRNLGYRCSRRSARTYTAGGFDIGEPEAYRNSTGVSLRIAYRLESEYSQRAGSAGRCCIQTLIVGDSSFLREATPEPTSQFKRIRWT